MFACNGILFNHESPIRGETFVTRKITRAVAKIVLGLQKNLFLGNLSAKRDWGHAKDYIRAMYLILQQDVAEDFVIATGVTTEVREFVRMAFEEVGVEVEFKGEGINEVGYAAHVRKDARYNDLTQHVKEGQELVKVDSRYFRPTEVELLIGDATKAREKLGWIPEFTLQDLVKDMVRNDLKLMKKDRYLSEGGFQTMNYFE